MRDNSRAQKPVQQVGRLIADLPLFAGLSPARLASLAQECHVRRLPRGAYLFLQGDQSDALYVVCAGVFDIVLSSQDGREMVINEMHAGDCFGELGLLTGRPRSAHAVARGAEGNAVLAIPRQTFLALLEAEPTLARRLLETTSQRLRNSGERESALAFLDAEARLARVLLWLDEEASEVGYITISQEELAQRACLIRQTVARILGRWRRRGWLLTGRGHIMLLNRDELGKIEPANSRQDHE